MGKLVLLAFVVSLAACGSFAKGGSYWSEWSVCSKECGGGERTRERLDTNPDRRCTIFNGGSCVEKEACNTQSCEDEASYDDPEPHNYYEYDDEISSTALPKAERQKRQISICGQSRDIIVKCCDEFNDSIAAVRCNSEQGVSEHCIYFGYCRDTCKYWYDEIEECNGGKEAAKTCCIEKGVPERCNCKADPVEEQ